MVIDYRCPLLVLPFYLIVIIIFTFKNISTAYSAEDQSQKVQVTKISLGSYNGAGNRSGTETKQRGVHVLPGENRGLENGETTWKSHGL